MKENKRENEWKGRDGEEKGKEGGEKEKGKIACSSECSYLRKVYYVVFRCSAIES